MKNVTKNDILSMFDKFGMAYGSKFNAPKKGTVEVWYDCLKGCCDEFIEQAAVECMKECEFPPTIAHIYKAHERIREQWEKERRELREWWDNAKSYYPDELKDAEAPELLFEAVQKLKTHDARIRLVQDLSSLVFNLVRSAEADDLPPMSECVKEVTKKWADRLKES